MTQFNYPFKAKVIGDRKWLEMVSGIKSKTVTITGEDCDGLLCAEADNRKCYVPLYYIQIPDKGGKHGN